jgi:hypothetical protein
MLKRTAFLILLLAIGKQAHGQGVVVFQDGVTELPNGDLYEGTIDTELRAAAPTTPQFENDNISVDQFDGGFQTQGAIRFENLLLSAGGLIPDELARDQIIFAELSLWKNSPSTSDANIDFSRVVGQDTTSGDFWQEDDTWASLGGDLIPNEAGLLDGDPITRDDVEAASVFDFQDNPDRFGPNDQVTLDPDEGPVLSSLVYTTDRDSENVFDDAWNGTEEDLARAIDLAFWRFDVTEAVRDWVADTDPAAPGAQPAQLNYGWAINNDTGDGWDIASSEVSEPIESEFEDLDPALFRPALTIIFDDGSAGPLDLNKDGTIDTTDFNEFLDLLGAELDAPLSTGSPGDFDFNRRIDLDDFKYFKENFPGGPEGLQAAVAAVPEPNGVLLAVLGLSVLPSALRRRGIV